jgi:hypothetical protein
LDDVSGFQIDELKVRYDGIAPGEFCGDAGDGSPDSSRMKHTIQMSKLSNEDKEKSHD